MISGFHSLCICVLPWVEERPFLIRAGGGVRLLAREMGLLMYTG